MAKTWQDVFITANGAATAASDPEPEEQKRGFFRRLRENLSKSREALGGELRATFSGPLDDETWERLEEILIYADVGARTTAKVVERLESEALEGTLAGGEDLERRLRELLTEVAKVGDDRIDVSHQPSVLLTVGVNGTGKTTTIAKVARREIDDGHTALLAAADTFRAAAADQLTEWAGRVGGDVVRGQEGADPGSVVYDAMSAAAGRGTGVVLVDTAGRMHTKVNLMEELKKILRVTERTPGAPQEVLLVIDATTGQNGLTQARLFAEAVGVTGVVLTKLDGTAKGGIVLAIEADLGIPVKLVGVGEAQEDLVPFDPEEFAAALFA
jgi:fused signal recognition particle receptor